MKKSMLNSFDPERRQCSHLVSFHAGCVEEEEEEKKREREREETADARHVVSVKRREKEIGKGIIVSQLAHHRHHHPTQPKKGEGKKERKII